MEILFAVLVLLAVALVCAVLLVLAEHYMGIEPDETVKKVRECLPGANCGACGYTGCDGYAEALAGGGAKANLCVPGSIAVAEKLAELLGVEAGEIAQKVAVVHCNGAAEATSRVAVLDGCSSCKAACLAAGGGEACLYSCLGCGDCASACPEGAISIKGGVAVVNPKLCIGCGICAGICPKNIITVIDRSAKAAVICSNHDKGAVTNKICKVGCIACRKCEKTCPSGAIKVENNLAKIDYSKCIGCLECVAVCPKGCIVSLDFSSDAAHDKKQ